MLSNALLLSMVLIGTLGEPNPDVNVNIDVNVNGKKTVGSPESPEILIDNTGCYDIYRRCRAKGDDEGVSAWCQSDTKECYEGVTFTDICGDDESCVCCVPKNVCNYTPCVTSNNGKGPETGRCSEEPIDGSDNWGETPACKSPRNCWVPVKCPNPCFNSKHVCRFCYGNDAEQRALDFTIKARGNPPTNPKVSINTVFYIPNNDQDIYALIGTKCNMKKHSITFHCTLGPDGKWKDCKNRGTCGSESDLAYIGHLYPETVKGQYCDKIDN